MKNAFKFMALGAALMISVVACKDDKDDDGNNGGNGGSSFSQELVIDGTKYTLNDGFIFVYGTDGGNAANFDINLITDGLTIIYDNDGIPDSAAGTGQVIYLETWSSDTVKIADGTYTLDTNSTNAGAISYAEIFTIANGEGTAFKEVASGSVQVSVSGNEHTITGSGKTKDGKDFSFSFKKDLNYISDDFFKKKFSLK
jgi:hypothetical protein